MKTSRALKCIWIRLSRKIRRTWEFYTVTWIWYPEEKMPLNEKGNWAFAPGFRAKRGVVHTSPEFLMGAEFWKEGWRREFKRRNLLFVEPTIDQLPAHHREYLLERQSTSTA